MKKLVRITVLFAFILLAPLFSIAQPQPGQQGPGGTGGDVGGGPIGGGAPIGSGMVLLISLGAGYGAKKVYDARKKLME